MAVVVSIAGCAATDATPPDDSRDPLEGFNRGMFAVHETVDTLIIRPAAVAWRDLVPEIIRTAVNNFLNYLRTPVILANDLLQGEWKRAGDTVERFAWNTLALGLVDMAHPQIPFHNEDFGQTLGVWGVSDEPYLVIPGLGPSNPRDAIGRVVDFFLDPIYWLTQGMQWDGPEATNVVRFVTFREELLPVTDDIARTSLDPYTTYREYYRQRRADEIKNRPVQARPQGSRSSSDVFKSFFSQAKEPAETAK